MSKAHVILGIVALAGAPAPAHADDLEEAALSLSSDDPNEVRDGIALAGRATEVEAVALLERRVRAGLPPDLLLAAVDTLGQMGRTESAALLRDLARHRRAEVRERAVLAYVLLHPPRTSAGETMFVEALGDRDPAVRSAAAAGLGALGHTTALPSLFKAYEHGVDGSAQSLAQLASPEHLDRILGYLGSDSFDRVEPMLLGLIERKDWSEKDKLRIVTGIQEIATPAAQKALESVSHMGKHVSPRVRHAAAGAATRIAN